MSRRVTGDGSVFYDKSRDRWVGALVTGHVGGKPVRRKVSAKTRTDAARKLRELREKMTAGQLPSGQVPTLEQWLNVWLNDIAAHRVKETTLPSYRSKVDRYLIPLLGHHRLDRLRPEHIEQAWRTMIDDKGLSPTTALQAHRILARALKVAQQRGYVQRNVATLIDAPSKVNEDMDVLTLDEAAKLVETAEGIRNGARWSVALSLGLRPGEALGLLWENVDLEQGVIHVKTALARITGKGLVLVTPKSRAGKRTIVLPTQLAAQMRAHRLVQNTERMAAGSAWTDGGYVFAQANGKPVDPRRDWSDWRDLLELAAVPHTRRYTARHTAATMLLAQGIPLRTVMEILGHSQVQVTMKYLHVADDMQRAGMQAVGDALYRRP